MAAYAALVSLLNNIHQIKSHPSLCTSLDNEHINPLLEKTGFLLDFMEGNNYGAGSKEAQDLERKIACTAHAAEDLIETRIVDQIHVAEGFHVSDSSGKSLDLLPIQPLLEKSNCLLDFIEGDNYGGGSKEAKDPDRKIASATNAAKDLIESNIADQIQAPAESSLTWSYLLTFLLKCVGCHLSDRSEKPVNLQRINADMDAIMKEAKQLKVGNRLGEEKLPMHPARPLTDSGESAMVGLDVELNQLLDELTGYQSSRRIISIVGMGGTGKTTLAKNVYEHLLIKENFQFRAWAAMSEQNNAKKILSELLYVLQESSKEAVDDLGLKLYKTLLGRKYFIVLDDLWSVEAWDEVKRFFPDNNNGSRILLTTRLSNVAKDCGSSLFMLKLLDEENSWKLFSSKAFKNEDCSPELRVVGKEIVKSCKGLALSIVVVGGLLLKSPRVVEYWKEVVTYLKYSKEKQDSLDVLSLSYNHLPPHLKPCFLYMGLLKADSQIRVSNTIKLWVGEGFIKPTGSRVLEEIAEGFIKDLIDRNLIVVAKRSKNGKVGSCGIHDLLRELCIKLAVQEEFFHLSGEGIRGTERRLVDDLHMEGAGPKLPLRRSVITRGCTKEPAQYRLLRVLDENGYNSQAKFFGNVNLRYIANHRLVKHWWKLPSSVSNLWNLQTLIISRSTIVVPTEFWKMRQLRHVHCRRIHIPSPHECNKQDGVLILENLQTLGKALNFRLCEKVCKNIPNIKKLHLIYNAHSMGYDDSLIDCLTNLDRLHKLVSLKLSIKRYVSLDRVVRERLTATFPSSLQKLSLKYCEIHWDDLTVIGSLPHLEVLKLDSLSISGGGEWGPLEGQFLHLQYMEIDYCDMVCWEADNSHFPVLQKLVLRNLNKFKEIPLGIGDISTLGLIRIEFCTNSAAISAARIKEEQMGMNDSLQVQLTVAGEHLDSFNRMLETEAITKDHIQFKYSKD